MHFYDSALCLFARSTRFRPLFWVATVVMISMITALRPTQVTAVDASKFAHSDSDANFLHHIDLYDANNRKITPESDQPYSSIKTCGRCHDYETISHGWHFNAFDPDATAGREGEPWIWTDTRTGTQLPLSYRDWSHTFDPRDLGLTTFEMTRQFGGRIPGGGVAAATDKADPNDDGDPADGDPADGDPADGDNEGGNTADGDNESAGDEQTDPTTSRWSLAGPLDVDCMICHSKPGVYDFNQRRDQIADENFAWAATAGLRLGTIDGNVSRIKDGSDPADESVKEKLPKVAYDARRFAPDGTVFMDLIRHPDSNACYQCHSQRTVDEQGVEPRWIHDEDVHLRAGMACVDCHRNGIDHHIVRGFPGEKNPSGHPVATLSCAGCHLGAQHADDPAGGETTGDHSDPVHGDLMRRAGRLGSPQPMHAGLPPIHFEKLSCTACHSGPAPREQALRIMTSLAHGLGDKGHRSGTELPIIQGPVYSKQPNGKVTPHRAMWPAYWGKLSDGVIEPISPEQVYELTRRTLRVRKDFVEELVRPKLSSSDLKEVLGEDCARVPEEEWTDADRTKADAKQAAKGAELFAEKVSAAIEALEEELKAEQVVYVSAGHVYTRGDEEKTLKQIDAAELSGVQMVQWPLAHNVRPAGWSLGITGCTECHSDDGKLFASTVRAMGPGPDQGEPLTMASLQGVNADQRLAWNELFSGRKSFKYIVAGSIGLLLMTLFIGVGAVAARLAGRQTA
ncbi:MAG: hypothetical protein HKN47_22705 [Pirellulaceae bacterium]|nr:hypothetical protein [Pirellulaceae bacterium]